MTTGRKNRKESHLGLALAGFRSLLIGHLSFAHRSNAVLAFLLGVRGFDLVGGSLEETDNLGFTRGSVVPEFGIELAVPKCKILVLAIDIEKNVLKFDILDKVVHKTGQVTVIVLAPSLSCVTMNKT